MPVYQSNAVKANRPAVTGERAGQVLSIDPEIGSLAILTTADTFEFATLPANHVPVNAILFCDDLDTGATPALVLDIGIEGGTLEELFNNTTLGQAGGVASPTLVTAYRITASAVDRKILGRVVTNAAGVPTTNARIGLKITYRPAIYGE